MRTITFDQEAEERLRRQTEDPEAPPVASLRDDAELDARTPGHDTISRLAYLHWQERGCPEGSPEEDWYQAEQDLRGA